MTRFDLFFCRDSPGTLSSHHRPAHQVIGDSKLPLSMDLREQCVCVPVALIRISSGDQKRWTNGGMICREMASRSRLCIIRDAHPQQQLQQTQQLKADRDQSLVMMAGADESKALGWVGRKEQFSCHYACYNTHKKNRPRQ